MPALGDHPVVRPGVPPPTTQVTLAPPPPPPCGLLMIQEAILRDAAADVAGIKLQMARAQSTAWLLEHGLAAVDVLDRTIRLLQGQRPVLLDQLAEVMLSGHQAEVPTIERSSARLRTSGSAGGGMSPSTPAWEVTLLRRPPGSGRPRVMGRARFQAQDVARAREQAAAALAARACGQPRWSLGLLRPLTPNAPGTHLYTVTFAAWEPREDRFIRCDVHDHEVWASDATCARRLACEQVQAVSGYRPAWRVRRVASE